MKYQSIFSYFIIFLMFTLPIATQAAPPHQQDSLEHRITKLEAIVVALQAALTAKRTTSTSAITDEATVQNSADIKVHSEKKSPRRSNSANRYHTSTRPR